METSVQVPCLPGGDLTASLAVVFRSDDGHLTRRTVRVLGRLHRMVYRVSRGAIGGRLAGNDMLLLTTTGRRSRRPRTVPLLFLRDGADLVVIASFGGRPHHPDWYRNLDHHPEAAVQVRGERFEVTARTAGPADRERLWPQVLDANSRYREYEARTGREIPVVLLSRRG
jgi:deazaflavin-dependent oxidoreductase (nitroreductase family)